MKWYKLKTNKCPKCDAKLDDLPRDGRMYCSKMACDFSIGLDRMQDIVNDQVQKYHSKSHDADLAGGAGWGRFNN